MPPLIEEILTAIRNSPEVRDAIRRELLTPELLDLPERFAEFAADTQRRLKNLEEGQEELRQGNAELRQGQEELRQGHSELRQGQEELRQGHSELRQGQEELRQGQEELRQGHSELRQGQEELRQRLDVLEEKHDSLTVIVMAMREDIRPLKAAHARNAMKDNALEITLPHNCLPIRELTKLDLYRMMRDGNPADISRNDQESFRNADLVVQAEHEDTGETHYFAVEASFTGGAGDVRRAVRNAGYLSRFTGSPAHAVVACVSVTPEAESAFTQDECARYQIPQRILEAE